MDKDTTYVALDDSKRTITAGILRPGERDPELRQIPNEPRILRRLVEHLTREGPVRVCYEAGVSGYDLHRQLTTLGIPCDVIAPALTPRRPGAADQDGSPCRGEAGPALPRRRAPPRSMCRRRPRKRSETSCAAATTFERTSSAGGIVSSSFSSGMGASIAPGPTGGSLTGPGSERSASIGAGLQRTLDATRFSLEQAQVRLVELDREDRSLAEHAPYREPVGWLRCFRGIDTLGAMILLAELVEFRRFRTPRELMAYVGLVPSEYSSGDTRRQGRITKAGNAHVRRILVEAAWHYRHGPRLGRAIAQRIHGQPRDVVAQALARPAAPPSTLPPSRGPRQARPDRDHRRRPRTGRLSLGSDDPGRPPGRRGIGNRPQPRHGESNELPEDRRRQDDAGTIGEPSAQPLRRPLR